MVCQLFSGFVTILTNSIFSAPYIKALKQAHPDWPVTAYVRSPQSESQLNADRVIVGDFSDFEKVKAASAEHDIAVNAGNSFTADPVAAIIVGQKSRATKGKVIHISGGGNFIDFGTSGNFNPESKVWNDANEDDIKAIHKEMFNGQSDTLVLEAGNGDDGIDTYIVCPSVVYGGASISSPILGVGYKLITGNAKPLGHVPYVGEGTAVLSTVRTPLPYPSPMLTPVVSHSGPRRLPRQNLRRCSPRPRQWFPIQPFLYAGN